MTKKKVSKKSPAKKSAKKPAAKTASKTATVTYQGVSIGGPLPAFKVKGTSGSEISNQDLKGKVTVLYFYPKDSTPGCTLEGYDFKAHLPKFKKLNAQIFGISRDSMKAHENFKAKCGFPFELLSDDSETLCKMFDVLQMKKLYGREYLGIERSTFVIDKDGKLAREWRKIKIEGHAAEVLEFVRQL
jgi:thioredoxin-dependent peroxiredoxin